MTIPVLLISASLVVVYSKDLRDKDTGRRKDGSVWSRGCVGPDGNDWGKDTSDSVGGRSNGVSGSSGRGGENFRGVSVKHTVWTLARVIDKYTRSGSRDSGNVRTESILEESSNTGQGVDLDVCLCLGKTEEDDSGSSGEKGHGEFTTASAPLDQRRSGDSTRYTTSRLVGECGIGVVQRSRLAVDGAEFAIEVCSEESIVERVSETDGRVAEDDERGGPGKSTGRE